MSGAKLLHSTHAAGPTTPSSSTFIHSRRASKEYLQPPSIQPWAASLLPTVTSRRNKFEILVLFFIVRHLKEIYMKVLIKPRLTPLVILMIPLSLSLSISLPLFSTRHHSSLGKKDIKEKGKYETITPRLNLLAILTRLFSYHSTCINKINSKTKRIENKTHDNNSPNKMTGDYNYFTVSQHTHTQRRK